MRIEQAEGIAWRRIGSETFVVDLRAKVMYGLNATGGALWQAIVDGEDLDVAIRRLAMADGAQLPEKAVAAAVATFTAELVELGLAQIDVRTERAAAQPIEEIEGFEAPQIMWCEEMVAYAQQNSCLFDNHLNCPAGPAT
jgi:hypothetical protein